MNKKITTLLITTLTLLITSCTPLPVHPTDSMTLACTNYANQYLTNKGLPPSAALDTTAAKIHGTATIPFTYTDHNATYHRATIDCTYKKGHATGTIHDNTAPTKTSTPEGMTYHNSVDWLPGLQKPRSIFPGAEIKNIDQSFYCSAGYLAENTNHELYILTAGHCGKPGDRFAIYEQHSTNYTVIGYMADTQVRYQDPEEKLIAGNDIGLIKITTPVWQSSHIPVKNTAFKGTMTAQQALDKGLSVCHLGRTTGFSCGNIIDSDNGGFRFWGLSDRGDSGGPIFAMDNNKNYWAIGVSSAVDDLAKTRPWGWEINDYMHKNNLHIAPELNTSPNQ